jgi:hypothetical protein
METKLSKFILLTLTLCQLSGFTLVSRAQGSFIEFNSPTGSPSDLAIDSSNNLYLSSSSNGLYVSTNQGKDWTQRYTLSGISNIAVTKPGVVYAITGTYIIRTNDSGNTWATIGHFVANYAYRFVIHGSDFYETGPQGTIGYSSDSGKTWNSRPVAGYGDDVRGLAVSKNGDLFVAITNSYDISGDRTFKSTNHGSNWQPVGYGSTDYFIFDDNDVLFDVYRGVSFDYGSDWTSFANSMGNTIYYPYGAAAYKGIYKTKTNSIFAFRDSGIFLTLDHGGTWTKKFNPPGPNDVPVAATDTSGYLYIATMTGKFLKSVDPITAVKSTHNGVISSFELYQAYPNPFNPSTTIEFIVPNAGLVELKVFDLLGRELETLVNEHKNSGRYSITWNATGRASGIYFYELRSGENFAVKRVVLLK